VHDSEKVAQIVEASSIDLVIDIENLFLYPDTDKYFQQVSQVLKDDGKFIVADFRWEATFDTLN
jgi:SAM-dependent methyltransferase